MTGKDYVMRHMSRSDLDIAIDWAAAEGWNPGLNDAECFYRSDPRGFFIGELSGKPIGSISAVSYDKHFGFIGFYIVKPEYRGQGYGIQMWETAMNYLKDRVVGLDGVLAQQENYQKSGFATAYRNIRYEGVASDLRRSQQKEIVELPKLPVAEILSYEKGLFPASRLDFIKGWINPGDGAALGYIKGNQLKGYGVIRACRHGYKIGPLFADENEIADAIFKELVARIKSGAPFFLDVPELNTAAVALTRQYKMQVVFETARMYRGQPPQLDLNRIFGVSSFELG